MLSVPAESEAVSEVAVDVSAVAVSDQTLVRDVCAVLAATLRPAPEGVAVTCAGQVYHVVATFPRGSIVEVARSDLETLTDVNPLRVVAASVFHDGERVHVKVRVCSYDHPVTVTDTQLVRVVKKRRWGLF